MTYLLIVDDDRDAATVLARYLHRRGHETQQVLNGQDALSSIMTRTPDLIVLDVRMPVMDGIDLLEVLRSYLRLGALPVCLYTAYPEVDVERTSHLNVGRIFTKAKATYPEILGWINQTLETGGGEADAAKRFPG